MTGQSLFTIALLTSERELSRILFDVWTVGRERGGEKPMDMAVVYAMNRSAITTLLSRR